MHRHPPPDQSMSPVINHNICGKYAINNAYAKIGTNVHAKTNISTTATATATATATI